MRVRGLPRCLLGAVLLAALAQVQATAAPAVPPPAPASAAPQPAVQRFMVRLRSGLSSAAYPAAPDRVAALAERHGLHVAEARHIVSGIHLLRVTPRPGESAAQTLARLRADPQLEYAEPDVRRRALAMPDDSLFGAQWYLQSAQPAAVNAVAAWDVTTGSSGLVIADLDTGVRFDHPDLRNASANRLLPGYNMISNAVVANDGDARDSDASDPGDWVTAADAKTTQFTGCTVTNSSWHGTRTAGILGAITNNTQGIAGVAWQGWIEPVRVLGKCGGYDSDILAGMAWAAGMPVSGVPANPYPARIINMSLGEAGGPCQQDFPAYQQIIDELGAPPYHVLVVVSAGNEGGPVDVPANCTGAVAVAGLRQVGTKVGYSSLGPEIAVSAPAGNCVTTGAGQPCQFSIITTSNSGTTGPANDIYTDQYNFNVGTSFSAPIVSGIAGLMLSVNGNLTPDQLMARLQAGATKPFPVSTVIDPTTGMPPPLCHVPTGPNDLQTKECSCTTQTCGAGIANAKGAVQQALRPIAAVAVPATVRAGSPVTLDASGSGAACHANIVSYAWSVVPPTTSPPAVIENANSARASIVAPSLPNTYTLMLTVTDDQGRTDSAMVLVSSSSAVTSAPAAAGNGACLSAVAYSVSAPNSNSAAAGGGGGHGGGGGALDLLTLLALAGYSRTAKARRHRAVAVAR
ncbi:MAG TPA: S8 family serine peptidase [Steroidobacteraceae bacterium]|nr:S8 family serine peptidase [Steroidobacteraceae bacterium]